MCVNFSKHGFDVYNWYYKPLLHYRQLYSVSPRVGPGRAIGSGASFGAEVDVGPGLINVGLV